MDRESLLHALDILEQQMADRESLQENYWLLREFIMTRAEGRDVGVLLKKRE